MEPTGHIPYSERKRLEAEAQRKQAEAVMSPDTEEVLRAAFVAEKLNPQEALDNVKRDGLGAFYAQVLDSYLNANTHIRISLEGVNVKPDARGHLSARYIIPRGVERAQ
jgi:hypothetical protein